MKFEIIPSPTNVHKELTTNESVSVLNVNDLTYNVFFKDYMIPNKPCLIRGVSENWICSRLWLKNNELDHEYLCKNYGDHNVTVYKCMERYYNSQKTYVTKFSSYLEYLIEDNKTRLDYLKDWHLKNNTVNDNFYEVPIFFASDWLNEYHVNCLDDDYRFVYMGPKGSWTPFHADVFSSYSWSVNVSGRKRWIFLPPGEETSLKDSCGNLPYDLGKIDISQKYCTIIQETGDAIFVPSGWHHQVWNMEDTISINHNWVNGCNIRYMYNAMASHLEEVRKEIVDCKDMPDFESHCQLMLGASFGINFQNFYEFVKYIALSRIDMLKESANRTLFHGHVIGHNHIIFDLKAIVDVLNSFTKSEVLESIQMNGLVPQDLLGHVIDAIKDYEMV